jgi:hypothetical protein
METQELEEAKKDRALQAHLIHYEAVRAEINSSTQAQTQIMYYSVAIIGGLVAVQTYISSAHEYVLLVASMLLAFLSWATLEMEIRIHDFRSYIDLTLRSRIQALIGPESPDQYKIMKMELAEQFSGSKLRSSMRGILVFGKFALTYIPALAFLLMFSQTKPFSPQPTWTEIETFLFVVDVFLCAVFPIGLIANLFYVLKYYNLRADIAKIQPVKRKHTR